MLQAMTSSMAELIYHLTVLLLERTLACIQFKNVGFHIHVIGHVGLQNTTSCILDLEL